MRTAIIWILFILGVAKLGAWMSNINVDACSRGSLRCGTAWWLIGLIVAGVLGTAYQVWRAGQVARERFEDPV